jgi:hypothetical protein
MHDELTKARTHTHTHTHICMRVKIRRGHTHEVLPESVLESCPDPDTDLGDEITAVKALAPNHLILTHYCAFTVCPLRQKKDFPIQYT